MQGTLDWLWATPPDETLRALGERLAQGELPDDRVLVKESRARSVWLLPQLAGGVVLKHYRVRGRDALKARVLPGRAESEFRSMETYIRRGLPTIRPVAYADRRDGGRLMESWFLCRLVHDARTLGEAVAAAEDDAARDRLVTRALLVVAELHAEPLYHRDLHAGNVLLDRDDRLLVIDLHSVWRVPRLSARMRDANIARLLHSMRGVVNLDRAPAYLAPYAEARGESLEALLVRFRRGYRRFADDYERGRSARCMRDSTEFERLRLESLSAGGPHGRLHHLRRYTEGELRADLGEHERVASEGGSALLGEQRRNRVTAVGAHVVKHYRDGGLYSRWRAVAGLGRARGAWRAARRCDVVGIPTPTALALLECPDGTAYLVTERVGGGTSLEEWLESWQRNAPVPELRAGLARSLGHLFGVMCRSGFRHSDLSTKNILLTGAEATTTPDRRTQPSAGLPGLTLIDLDGARRVAPFDPAAQARMLGQLMDVPAGVSRTDRLRVLRGFEASAGRSIPPRVLERALELVSARVARRERLISTRRGHGPAASPHSG